MGMRVRAALEPEEHKTEPPPVGGGGPQRDSGTVADHLLRATRGLRGDLLHGIAVCAVDDHADSRDLARLVLTRYGATVIVAGSAEEALGLAEQAMPDVLVTDLAMPERDGYWLLRELRTRAAREGRWVGAIAVTAFTADHSAERALSAGFDAYLPKPFTADDLCLAVAAILGR